MENLVEDARFDRLDYIRVIHNFTFVQIQQELYQGDGALGLH